jgi:hypothetical protein
MTFKTKALLTWMGTATPAGPQVALLLGNRRTGRCYGIDNIRRRYCSGHVLAQ